MEKNRINEFSQVLASLEPENVRGSYYGINVLAGFNENAFLNYCIQWGTLLKIYISIIKSGLNYIARFVQKMIACMT